MSEQALDVELTARKSDGMDDWYVIERKEHDGRAWVEPRPYGGAFMTSARIGNADIEGTAAEMRAIAEAIKGGDYASFRRCAAETRDDGVLLSSPRNSIEPTLVTVERAFALADEILATVPAHPADPETTQRGR